MRTLLVLMTALLTLTTPATADAPRTRVRALIGQLGHREFAVRERATQQLIAIGRPAQAALRAALMAGDAEVRFRARQILDAIQPRPAREPERPRVIAEPEGPHDAPAGPDQPIEVREVLHNGVLSSLTRTRKGVVVETDEGTLEFPSLAELARRRPDLARRFGVNADTPAQAAPVRPRAVPRPEPRPSARQPRPASPAPGAPLAAPPIPAGAGSDADWPRFGTRLGGATPTQLGLRVESVRSGSPAARAGLRTGDRLVKVQGQLIERAADVEKALGRVQVGQPYSVVAFRDGRVLRLRDRRR